MFLCRKHPRKRIKNMHVEMRKTLSRKSFYLLSYADAFIKKNSLFLYRVSPFLKLRLLKPMKSKRPTLHSSLSLNIQLHQKQASCFPFTDLCHRNVSCFNLFSRFCPYKFVNRLWIKFMLIQHHFDIQTCKLDQRR